MLNKKLIHSMGIETTERRILTDEMEFNRSCYQFMALACPTFLGYVTNAYNTGYNIEKLAEETTLEDLLALNCGFWLANIRRDADYLAPRILGAAKFVEALNGN